MLQLSIKDVISKIQSETGLSEAEVRKQIATKVQALDGLVSEDGAAYIVASELGVHLFKDTHSGTIKIKDIVAGMQSIETVGKVMRTFNPITFTGKDGKPKQVASFILADETGEIRTVIWDQRVSWITEGRLKENLTVKIKDAYAKQNNLGNKELHLGYKSSLILEPKNVSVNVITKSVEKKKISEIKENEFVSVLGEIVQIFSPKFYNTCSKCGKKVTMDVAGAICAEHKTVQAKPAMVLNFVLDDSTETLRVVTFGERAEKLINLSVLEVQDMLAKDGPERLQESIDNFVLGKTVSIKGKIIKNENFDRLEMRAANIDVNPDAKQIAIELLKMRNG